MNTNLGEIIASRHIDCDSYDASGVDIQIGKPRQFEDSEDYYIVYQISGLGKVTVSSVGGVDSIQCLQLVMKAISADLWRLGEAEGKRLRWNGSDEDLGFPV